jgi:peptide/nickel transport system substrate-binding protein
MKKFSAAVVAALLLAASCGSDSDDVASEDTAAAVETDDVASEDTAAAVETDETSAPSEPEADGEQEAAGACGTLRFGNFIDLLTFDAHVAQAGPQMAFLGPVYDGLLRLDTEGMVQPALAEEWEYIDDVTLELRLRDGVAFHDGAAFDAEVVRANIERVQTSEGRNATVFEAVEQVEVVDPMTVRLHLTAPVPNLLVTLSEQAGFMISPDAMTDPDLDRNPVGTGPYRYDAQASQAADTYVFTAFEDYWDPSAQGVEQVEVVVLTDEDARFNALQSGQVDVAEITPAQAELAQSAGLQIVEGSGLFYHLFVQDRDGTMVPELGDPRVRQAMAYAVDREAMVDAIAFGFGTPAAQPYAEGNMAHVAGLDDEFTYDPDRARALLQEAGVDGFSFRTVTLPTYSSLAEATQAYLAEVGINMEIQLVEPGTLGAAGRSGEHPTWFGRWIALEPAQNFTLLWAEGAPYNPFAAVNPVVQENGQEAGSITDQDRRTELYQEMLTEMVGEAWSTVLYRTGSLLSNEPSVEGVGLAPGRSVPDFRGVRVEC